MADAVATYGLARVKAIETWGVDSDASQLDRRGKAIPYTPARYAGELFRALQNAAANAVTRVQAGESGVLATTVKGVDWALFGDVFHSEPPQAGDIEVAFARASLVTMAALKTGGLGSRKRKGVTVLNAVSNEAFWNGALALALVAGSSEVAFAPSELAHAWIAGAREGWNNAVGFVTDTVKDGAKLVGDVAGGALSGIVDAITGNPVLAAAGVVGGYLVIRKMGVIA